MKNIIITGLALYGSYHLFKYLDKRYNILSKISKKDEKEVVVNTENIEQRSTHQPMNLTSVRQNKTWLDSRVDPYEFVRKYCSINTVV